MAENLDLSEMMRRTLQANARFYKGWVDLSLEYFRGIAGIFGGEAEGGPPAEEPEAGSGALVLEGVEGAMAGGAFLITNDLGRKLTCELVATDFRDADGNSVRAKPVFEPAKVELAPGEQRVVRVSMPVGGGLEAGVPYAGAFAVKGMDGFSVPVVLRRQHGVVESPIDRVAGETSGEPRAGRAAGGRKTGAKKAAGKKATKKKAARKKAARKKAPKKKAARPTA